MRALTIVAIGALTATVACQDGAKPDDTVTVDTAKAASGVAATATAPGAHVHNVACACSMGKSCGTMIEVDGNFVPLTGDIGLGAMAFCGKAGLKAEVTGKVADGAFVAESFKLVGK